MSRLKKSAFIGLGALVLSTVAIQASDIVGGVQSNLSGMVIESEGVCGPGTVEVLFGSHALCVDVYEASPSIACPSKDIANQLSTQENMNEDECLPESKPEVMPWRYVSLTQAQQLCARVGKRLPSNEEWYKIASGLNAESCTLTEKRSAPMLTGKAQCIAPSGVQDLVGNVWEWVDEEVVNGSFEGVELPETGYVTLVNSNGVVVQTADVASDEFGKDYAWTDNEGVFGMIRGGFYGSGEDAGIFTQNMAIPFDFKTAGVGFRCVKDI